MSHVAIDLGDKRVGIAYTNQGIVFPVKTIMRTDTISFLKKFLGEHSDIDTLVVGLPYDLYGMDTKQLDKTQAFMKKLSKAFQDHTIVGHDERFSSYEASLYDSSHRDDIAAACILQSYLDTKKI